MDLGIVGQITGRVIAASEVPVAVVLGSAIALAAFVAFIWGCAQYAKAKGHSGWLGLLAVLSLLGLLILAFLPDKHDVAGTADT